MNFRQSTLDEIVDSERLMVLSAEQCYGALYSHARTCSIFLSVCIQEIVPDRVDTFGRLFAHLKKHLLLALLSTVRLHRVQAKMNLRQVLEAGAAAAFAIAKPGREHFAKLDSNGLLNPSKDLTEKRYKWLQKHYSQQATWIKNTKDQLNLSSLHANIVAADSVFQISENEDAAEAPFFDIEDDYHVKADLWLIGSISVTLMDLLYGVNLKHQALKFRPEFSATINRLAEQSNALLTDMKKTDRYQTAMQRLGLQNQ